MYIKSYRGRESGVLMIEVLITILIVSLGLLGIAAMFVRSQLIGDEAYQRYVALQIAHQLSERLSTNEQQGLLAELSGYVTGTTGTLPGDNAYVPAAPCSSGCITTQVVGNDLGAFHDALVGNQKVRSGNKVAALVNARGCVEFLGPNGGAPMAFDDPRRYRISVVWEGRQASAETTNPTLCGNGIYGPGLRRAVSLEVEGRGS